MRIAPSSTGRGPNRSTRVPVRGREQQGQDGLPGQQARGHRDRDAADRHQVHDQQGQGQAAAQRVQELPDEQPAHGAVGDPPHVLHSGEDTAWGPSNHGARVAPAFRAWSAPAVSCSRVVPESRRAHRHLERELPDRSAAPAPGPGSSGRCPTSCAFRRPSWPTRPSRATSGALGYEFVHRGQGQWNGVAILSRGSGISRARDRPPGGARIPRPRPIPRRRASSPRPAAACGWPGVYVPNGRTADDPHYDYKLAWLARAGRAPGTGGGRRTCRSPSSATSTSRPPTTTCGTSPRSPGARTSPRRSAPRWPSCGRWACPTSCPRSARGRTPTPSGTTARAPSTRRWACASTWCTATPRSPARSGGGRRPGGAQARGQGHPAAQRPRAGGRGPGLSARGRPLPAGTLRCA